MSKEDTRSRRTERKYRKVEIATWNDERFRALSAAPPNGQTLWLYLLTGPRTTTFPGLVVAREAVLADDLGWNVEAFREAFREALAQGLVDADWKVGVVVLRRALIDSHGDPRESSRPASPNVIRSWALSWSDIPECDLKRIYLQTLGSFAEALGPSFGEAFREAFRKALSQPSHHPSCNQDAGCRSQDTGTGSGSDCAPPAPSNTRPRRLCAQPRAARPCPIPEDWSPRSEELDLARTLKADAIHETASFCDHHRAKGSQFVDWNAAFRTWLRNSVKFNRGGGARGGASFFEVLDSLPRSAPLEAS